MFSLIERFMDRLNPNEVNDFALKNGVVLSEEELEFTYEFIKKNWSQIIKNPSLLDFSKYKDKYSEENFNKIERLINEYLMKYQRFL